MENEKKANDKKPVQKPGCCNFDRLHWFLKLFLVAVIAAFILAVAVAISGWEGRHKGKFGYGYRNERGGNIMYYKKGEFGQRGVFSGGGPMTWGYVQSMPGIFNTFTAPTSGMIISGGAALANPYTFSDLADVFMVSGTVTNVTTTKITLTDLSKAEKTVNVSADTKVKSGDTDVNFSDIKTGDNISVVNLPDADGAMSAQLIRILAK
jgi:hypothetical protein